jgi:hypothetical protein
MHSFLILSFFGTKPPVEGHAVAKPQIQGKKSLCILANLTFGLNYLRPALALYTPFPCARKTQFLLIPHPVLVEF